MDWLNLGIQLGILIVTVAIGWGALKTKIALTAQRLSQLDKRLDFIESNHLTHMQADIIDIKLALVRIEEHLKQS